MKKLLIIGGNGLVGSTLVKYAKTKYDIHITINKNKSIFSDVSTTKIELINDQASMIDLIKNFNPDVVVSTAAHSSVDFCETDHKLANALHVDAINYIAKVCKQIDTKLIFLSTDAVFDGKSNMKYTENDVPSPVNYYGKTKLKAENIVLQSSKKNVVLRTAVIYGWHKSSKFTNWILSSLHQNKVVDPFSDQYNTPTLVDDLAKSILNIIEMDISGLFHAVGNTCINRYEFALLLADKFDLEKNLVKPVTSSEKKQHAPRPFRTCLDASKLEKILNFKFCNLDDGVSFIINQSKSEKMFDETNN